MKESLKKLSIASLFAAILFASFSPNTTLAASSGWFSSDNSGYGYYASDYEVENKGYEYYISDYESSTLNLPDYGYAYYESDYSYYSGYDDVRNGYQYYASDESYEYDNVKNGYKYYASDFDDYGPIFK